MLRLDNAGFMPLAGRLCLAGLLILLSLVGVAAAAQDDKSAPRPDAEEGRIVITTVFDNLAFARSLETAWGFAAVIETAGGTVLFDTGGDHKVLLANMGRMNIRPQTVDAVVISHIHSDHLGGLFGFLEKQSPVRVHIPASFPDTMRRKVRAAGAEIMDVKAPALIVPGIFTTGPLGNGLHEQALVVDTAEGLVIITGCAHPGIVLIVEAAKAQHPGRPVALVMGGFHLRSASRTEVENIALSLRRLGVRKVAPSHCTGDAARRQLRQIYGPDFIEAGTGKTLRFDHTHMHR